MVPRKIHDPELLESREGRGKTRKLVIRRVENLEELAPAWCC